MTRKQRLARGILAFGALTGAVLIVAAVYGVGGVGALGMYAILAGTLALFIWAVVEA